MRKFSIVIFALTTMIGFGCRPICYTVITNIDTERKDWFGPDIKLGRGRSWDKLENCFDHTIYFDQVDMNDLSNCETCQPIKIKLKHNIETNFVPFLASNGKRTSIVNDRIHADYIAQIKIVSIKESRPILKMPLWGTGSDVFEFWIKIVNKRTSRIIFGYKAGGPMETELHIRAVAREFERALESDKAHS